MSQTMIDEITKQLNKVKENPLLNQIEREHVSVLAFWSDGPSAITGAIIQRTHLYPAGTSTVTANRKTINQIKSLFPNAVILGLITTEAAPQ